MLKTLCIVVITLGLLACPAVTSAQQPDFVDSVLVYNSLTGDVSIQANGNRIYVLDVNSASASFIPGNLQYPAGYDADFSGIDPTSFSIEAIGHSFGDIDLKNILPAGLSADFIANDLSGDYGVDGIFGDQQIVVTTVPSMPEPACILLLAAFTLLLWREDKSVSA